MRNNPDGAARSSVPSPGVDRAGGPDRGLIEELRHRIRGIEQVPVTFGNPPAQGTAPLPPACLSASPETAEDTAAAPPLHKLGEPGLHELKPASYGDMPAAIGFALGLLRLQCQAAARRGEVSLLWCLTETQLKEWGAPYAPGLIRFGLDPGALLVVKTRTAKDAAWVLEEALKSGALAGLLGQAEIERPVMARRLGLAAKQGGLPLLLLPGDAAAGGLPGSLTRWRIAAESSPPSSLDGRAPGAFAVRLALERAPGNPPQRSWRLEWHKLIGEAQQERQHATYRFRLAPPLADRAADAAAEETSGRAAKRGG